MITSEAVEMSFEIADRLDSCYGSVGLTKLFGTFWHAFSSCFVVNFKKTILNFLTAIMVIALLDLGRSLFGFGRL